jgi:hypothetical protein
MGSYLESLENADSLDLVYTLRIDSWQGEESVLLEVEDIF